MTAIRSNVVKNLKALFVLLAAGSFLIQAQAQTSSNTLVRFRVSNGGKALGEMVVELFDRQRPITVSNFLNYVRSGRYSTNHTILHQSYPGLIIGGGAVGVCNPYVAGVYRDPLIVPTDPPIPNESQLPPFLSNTLGTISMLTDLNQPNSATSSWFFNLGNNVGLDTNNGGYCVFGRVKTGLDFLKRFNTTYTHRIYYRAYYGDGPDDYVEFDSLPVPYVGTYLPYNSELFLVDISIVTNDAVRPTVSISTPAAGAEVTTNSVVVSGTVSDAGGFGTVDTYLNFNCPIATAPAGNSWSLLLTNLWPGTNLIVAQSTDRAGNNSAPSYRTVFHKIPWPITLLVAGAGKVSGVTNGQVLDIYRRYIVSATPDPGNLFVGWTGGVQQATLAVGFYMETNFSLTAKFVTNRFPQVKGVYTGLFRETNNAPPNTDHVRPNSSGMITITVGSSIGWSGKVMMEGRTHPISGSFDPYGFGYTFIDRRPYDDYAPFLRFRIDLENPDGRITGDILGNGWTAEVEAYLVSQSSTANPSPFKDKYTWVLPGGTDPDLTAFGDGFGTVTVDALGKVTFSGTLPDGSRLLQRTPLVGNGKLPVYFPLYTGKGSGFGFVNFDRTQDLTDLSGAVTWSKPVMATAKYNKPGFTNTTLLIGSRYIAPVGTTSAVTRITNGVVEFTGGNLTTSFANDVTIGRGDKVTNGSPNNKLTLTFTKPTGLLNGNVTPPGSTRAIPFKGAFLQKSNFGSGFFQDSSRIGRVFLSPATP